MPGLSESGTRSGSLRRKNFGLLALLVLVRLANARSGSERTRLYAYANFPFSLARNARRVAAAFDNGPTIRWLSTWRNKRVPAGAYASFPLAIAAWTVWSVFSISEPRASSCSTLGSFWATRSA